jgi:hypothetical protein
MIKKYRGKNVVELYSLMYRTIYDIDSSDTKLIGSELGRLGFDFLQVQNFYLAFEFERSSNKVSTGYISSFAVYLFSHLPHLHTLSKTTYVI